MMEDKDIMECCLAVLAFLNDERDYHPISDCETMKEMDRVLAKNDFFSSVYGTNMVCFMRWLSCEYCLVGPDEFDSQRDYFSGGGAQSRAKLNLKYVIRHLRLNEIC